MSRVALVLSALLLASPVSAQIASGGGGGSSAPDLTQASGTLPLANMPAGSMFRAGVLSSANMNVTTDQTITLTGPASGNWTVIRFTVTNCSGPAGTAAGALYGATAKGGGIMVGQTTSQGPSVSGLGGARDYTHDPAIGATKYTPVFSSSSQSVFYSLTTAQGSAVTCDVYVYGQTL